MRCRTRAGLPLALLLAFACAGCGAPALPPLPALQMDTFNPGAQAQIGNVLDRLETQPNDAAANGRLGLILHAYRHFDAAAICYERTRKLQPREFDWAYYHASVLEALAQYPEALAVMNEALELDGDYPPARLGAARLTAASGDELRSVAMLEQLTRAMPDYADARYELGVAYARNDRLDDATAQFRAALNTAGSFGPAHYALALAYRSQGDQENADRQFGLFEQHRHTPQPRDDRLLATMQRFNESEQKLIERAQAAAGAGRLADSVQILEESVRRDPESTAVLATLVALYGQIGRFDLIDTAYEQALAIDADMPELHHNLGLARMYERRYTEAVPAFERALAINPQRRDTYLRLGRCHEALGRNDLAIADYRRGLAVRPDYRRLRQVLAERLLEAGEPAEAVAHLEQLLEPVDKRTPEVMLTLAQVYADEGRSGEARVLLERARGLVDRPAQARLATQIDIALRKLAAAP